MILYPAMDLMRGFVVRLKQGNPQVSTVYSKDPVAMALMFEMQGAEWLHIVDLDAALGRKTRNREIIREILRRVKIPIQLGGGIRSADTTKKWLDLGVGRIVLGTAAAAHPRFVDEALHCFGSSRIAVSLDVREDRVFAWGWIRESGADVFSMAMEMARKGIQNLIVTDIQRDGMMSGPNLDLWRAVGIQAGVGIIGSGGIRHFEDIKASASIGWPLEGIIMGRCLYEGCMDLSKTMKDLYRGDLCSRNG